MDPGHHLFPLRTTEDWCTWGSDPLLVAFLRPFPMGKTKDIRRERKSIRGGEGDDGGRTWDSRCQMQRTLCRHLQAARKRQG